MKTRPSENGFVLVLQPSKFFPNRLGWKVVKQAEILKGQK